MYDLNMTKKKPGIAQLLVLRVDDNCPDTNWFPLDGKHEIPITIAPMSPEQEELFGRKLAQWFWNNRHIASKLKSC